MILLLEPGVEKPDAPGYLVKLKDELESFGPGACMISFACLGPKSYSYQVVDKDGKVVDSVIKVKGISLN